MSSDDSFVWTSASDGNISDSGDRTIQDSYKMKVEEQEDNDVSTFEESAIQEKGKKRRAKKRKSSKLEVTEEVTKNNNIKDEPVSDIDSRKSKIKLKQELCRDSNGDNYSVFDDSYLNLRVKEEQTSCVDEPKISTKKKKKKKKHSDIQSSDIDENITESGNIGKFDNNYFSNLSIDDKVTIEETVISRAYINCAEQIDDEKTNDVRHNKKKKKHKKSLTENCDLTEIDNGNNSTILNFKNDTHIADYTEISSNGNGYVSDIENNRNISISKKAQKTSKVSDRIRFEDDISDIDINHTKNQTKTDKDNAKAKSKQVRQYLKKNLNLQPLSSKAKEDSIVTDNDDIWLLRCPHDIDIMSFKGISLNSYNNRKKLKIKDKVYDSIVENDLTKLPILTYYSQNKPIIKNIKLNGCIVLKNKVPKVNIPENETIINDQTNFIPLPETKCRHPLFGVNYKKSIKIPAEIANRLKSSGSINVLDEDERKKKKKQKKDKRKSHREVEENEEVNLEEEVVCKKKKKRKHSLDNNPPVKVKRVKRDPDCAHTWESEKAIEETLFNF